MVVVQALIKIFQMYVSTYIFRMIKLTLSLDSSGESLHKRGYREETGTSSN